MLEYYGARRDSVSLRHARGPSMVGHFEQTLTPTGSHGQEVSQRAAALPPLGFPFFFPNFLTLVAEPEHSVLR